MENELLSKMSNEEKIVLFDITLEQAKNSGKTFESQISSVITAFLIKKKKDAEMNMAPKPEFVQEPFEMNMAPKPEFVQEHFEMNMTPKKINTSGDYDGPTLEPIDTQKVENNYGINI